MKCNKCKGEMISVDIIELNGRIHHAEVCVMCGNMHTSRIDKWELAHLELKSDNKVVAV